MNGIFIKDTVLFAQHYTGAKENIYYIWKEDKTSEPHATIRNKMINDIVFKVLKYFSLDHKKTARQLTGSLMLDKITWAEFRAIYIKVTGNQSVSETKVTQEVDECLIMNNLTPCLAKDLQVNNARKSKFDVWDICSKVLDEFTAVNNRRHCPGSEETSEVVGNMAVVISAPSLYQKCKTEALKSLSEEEIPSLSWFKFQFCP